MASPFSCCVVAALILAACTPSEEPLPAGDPVAVSYEAACDSTNHQELVILEGYLHLFPRLLSCYPGGNAQSGRSCQIKLLPKVDAPTGSVEQERAYYTTFIDEGRQPNQLDIRGYGLSGSPAKVLTADSTLVDPYDRVRITGRFHASGRASGGDGLLCTLTADQIEIAEAADVSWADEREAEREELQARIDSMRAAMED